MANQQLVEYIKGQLAAGVSKADLEKAITIAGWNVKDSADAFATAEGRPMAPPPVVPPPAAQPVRPTTMQMNVEMGARRSMWPWVLLVVAALLVASVTAAYYFVPAVQEIVAFYISGGVPAPVETTDTAPVVPAGAAITATTTSAAPAATSTATSSPQ